MMQHVHMSLGESVFKNPLDNLDDADDGGSLENGNRSPTVDHHDPYGARSNDDHRTNRTEEINVDLDTDHSIVVDISDALSERDKVKYTVHTRCSIPDMKSESSVVREHEEFIWLHSTLDENENYAGFIIPPPPPKPDFDTSREKLQKLGENEATMTRDEFLNCKQELEQDYLATFKKTVAMHEVFLQRLAAHPVFRRDQNLKIFLQYEDDLNVRGRNKKELMESVWKRFTQSADEVLLSGQKDVDEFFDHERNYVLEYHTHIKEAATRAAKMVQLRKDAAEWCGKMAEGLERMARAEPDKTAARTLAVGADTLHKLKKVECRSSNDEELKLADTLSYFQRDTNAAKDLLYRRMRCLANYESANKNLERARGRNKDIPKAETEQMTACTKFEDISALAKTELKELKRRRVAAFKKNLADLAELQIKHSKAQIALLHSAIDSLKD